MIPEERTYDENDILPTAAWVDKQVARGNEDEVDEQMREELLVEAQTFDTDVFMDDHETVVVSTESFTGSHVVSTDRDGVHVTEVGFYVHDDTEWEMDVSCPIDVYRLEEEARKANDTPSRDHASLTVGERNPSLGSGRRI